MGNWDCCSIKPRSRHIKTRPYICMGDVESVEGPPNDYIRKDKFRKAILIFSIDIYVSGK